MKGSLYKTDNGWVVRYRVESSMTWRKGNPESLTFENKELPLNPDDVKQIEEDSKVFDNIEARIKCYPDVEFEIEERWVNSGGFEKGSMIKVEYAKLVYPTGKWNIEQSNAVNSQYGNDVRINLEPMPKEEWLESRNPAYKHFDKSHISGPTFEQFERDLIELHKKMKDPFPTDEEITVAAKRQHEQIIKMEAGNFHYVPYGAGFWDGAKWVIEYLKDKK